MKCTDLFIVRVGHHTNNTHPRTRTEIVTGYDLKKIEFLDRKDGSITRHSRCFRLGIALSVLITIVSGRVQFFLSVSETPTFLEGRFSSRDLKAVYLASLFGRLPQNLIPLLFLIFAFIYVVHLSREPTTLPILAQHNPNVASPSKFQRPGQPNH
jgi:hypothetical protein